MRFNIFKRNQIIILVIALMLVTAGYLNFTANHEQTEIASSISLADSTKQIGDATLVNSKNVIQENTNITEKNNIIEINSSNELSTNTVNNTISTEAKIETNDYFTTSRLEREKMYSQMLESYQKMFENTNVTSEQKAIAANEITKINQTKNAIMIAENLIKTKGFEDIIIFVNTDSVSVIVKKDKLETEEIAQIQNIIVRELKTEVENIHISNQ